MGRSGESVVSFVNPVYVPMVGQAQARRRLGGVQLSQRRLLLLVGDIAFLSLALYAALWLRRLPVLGETGVRLVLRWSWWAVLWALWIPLAVATQGYDLRRATRTAEGAPFAACLALAVSALYLLVPVISAPLTRSRLAWFIFALLAMVGVGSWRAVYALLMRRPKLSCRALVIGAGDAGRVVAETVDSLGEASGVEVIGFIDNEAALQGQTVANRRILGAYDSLASLAEQLQIDELVVAVTDAAQMSEALLRTLERCWARGIAVRPVQLYFEEITGAVMVQHIGQNIFVLMNDGGACWQRLWDALRRPIDVIVGIVGLLLLAPFVPFIALAIYWDSRGSVFYRQQRVGQRGQTFWLTKFRTMIPDAERNGAVWAAMDDDRVTRVGRWLRKMRIDELPQMWNLLTGSMTLIGPRPERPEFVRDLDRLLPYYRVRHAVKPGLTGWAQVRYRYGSNMDDALMKLQYDLYYVKHRGPLLDMLIALETVRVVLALQGT